VIAGRPQEAVHAGGNDCQSPCGSLLFTLWMLFLMPNEQCQSTEGNYFTATKTAKIKKVILVLQLIAPGGRV